MGLVPRHRPFRLQIQAGGNQVWQEHSPTMLPLLHLGLWQHSWVASSTWDTERCHVAWGLLHHQAILKADPLPAMFPPVSHPHPQPASLPPLPVSLPAVPGIYNTYYLLKYAAIR